MAKRFTDTEKWTKNKWFRKLPNDYKLLWLFILDNCDSVGVWEEDIEFVSDLLGISVDDAQAKFFNQIQIINGGKKWWIKNFCFYQYGELKEENIKNKPHQKYISELKKHRLWIDYTKTIHSLKEKDKEEEKEEDKEEEKDPLEFPKENQLLIPAMMDEWKKVRKDYPADTRKDSPALQSIAQFICKQLKVAFNPRDGNVVIEIMESWKYLCQYIAKHKFFKGYSLQQVDRHLQSIINDVQNERDNPTTSAGNSASLRKSVHEAHAKRYSGG